MTARPETVGATPPLDVHDAFRDAIDYPPQGRTNVEACIEVADRLVANAVRAEQATTVRLVNADRRATARRLREIAVIDGHDAMRDALVELADAIDPGSDTADPVTAAVQAERRRIRGAVDGLVAQAGDPNLAADFEGHEYHSGYGDALDNVLDALDPEGGQ